MNEHETVDKPVPKPITKPIWEYRHEMAVARIGGLVAGLIYGILIALAAPYALRVLGRLYHLHPVWFMGMIGAIVGVWLVRNRLRLQRYL
jgi:hypothetical protein